MKKSKIDKPYAGKIPFDVFGNQLHYPEGYTTWYKEEDLVNGDIFVERGWNPVEKKKVFFTPEQINFERFSEPQKNFSWGGEALYLGRSDGLVELDNHIFEDELTYDSYARGRSAAYFKFSRSDGRLITMFLTDFEQVVQKMVNGKIKGKFTFCKRGANFGCRLIK